MFNAGKETALYCLSRTPVWVSRLDLVLVSLISPDAQRYSLRGYCLYSADYGVSLVCCAAYGYHLLGLRCLKKEDLIRRCAYAWEAVRIRLSKFKEETGEALKILIQKQRIEEVGLTPKQYRNRCVVKPSQ